VPETQDFGLGSRFWARATLVFALLGPFFVLTLLSIDFNPLESANSSLQFPNSPITDQLGRWLRWLPSFYMFTGVAALCAGQLHVLFSWLTRRVKHPRLVQPLVGAAAGILGVYPNSLVWGYPIELANPLRQPWSLAALVGALCGAAIALLSSREERVSRAGA
jgi:hypothetical protein